MSSNLESIDPTMLTTVIGGEGLPERRAGNLLPDSGTGIDVPAFVAGRRIEHVRIPEFAAGRQVGWLLL